MQLSAKELATLVNGAVEGDPDVIIDRLSKIEEAGPGSVTFLGNPRYEPLAYTTLASVILVDRHFKPRQALSATLLRVDDVYQAVRRVLEYFQNTISPPKGIDDTAFIHPSAQLGQGVSVGMFSIIEAHAVIGDGAYLHPQVYVGSRARLGKNVVLFPGARVMHGCEVGDNCIIHPNAVIGSDGFGFSRDGDGVYQKIPQLGNVIIEDNVEIGACTTIDRPAMGSTILHAGVKLDNLIQIGHGVTVGKNTVMAAQAGVAGSTHIGENCQIGGQAGFIGHLRIADGLRIQAQSGIASSVKKPNQDLFGYPAIPYKNYVRSYAVFKQLPDLYKRLHQLEKLVKEMRGGAPPTDPEG